MKSAGKTAISVARYLFERISILAAFPNSFKIKRCILIAVSSVVAAKEMLALAFSTTPNNWRRVAHIISDKIYQRLTGEEGYFDTRIIYVSETGEKTQRFKKLMFLKLVKNFERM